MDLTDLIDDRTSKTYFEYQYSLVQLHIPKTMEILNLGVILYDFEKKPYFKKIPSVNKLIDCLKLESFSGIEYNFRILENRIRHLGTEGQGKVSDLINTTPLMPYIHNSNNPREVLNEIFDDTISIMNGMGDKPAREVNLHTKFKIVNSLKKSIEGKSFFSEFEFNKQFNNVYKRVDTVTYVNESPIIGAEVVSPYVSDFKESFGMTFLVSQQIGTMLKDFIIYMPLYKDSQIPKKNRNVYSSARATLKEKQIRIIDSADQNNFIGELDELTRKNAEILF